MKRLLIMFLFIAIFFIIFKINFSKEKENFQQQTQKTVLTKCDKKRKFRFNFSF